MLREQFSGVKRAETIAQDADDLAAAILRKLAADPLRQGAGAVKTAGGSHAA